MRAIAVDQPEPTVPIARSAEFAVDQNPIENSVDDVGRDQCERHRANHVHGLQAPANREVQQKRERVPR